ncbi:CoA-binding protein [Helicobacter sp. MIT 21-1697]|uniref:CoA-binding protein n=1 Tax=Helicobacter sp. MIT 21-1697 TaxID=2993733 RepID=UPI00224B9C39|nr:CoA-binding protein [Helicobacter sp. MIT 21-1697]MCX2716303.1 CoA-binding protein [Helicobacter sp. MIT 21-1697]
MHENHTQEMYLSDTHKRTLLESAKIIAIVGLSPDENKASYQVAQYLLDNGYEIVPIYPRGGEILKRKAFNSLSEAFTYLAQTGRVCDIINIFRKSEALPNVMREICSLDGISSFDKKRMCVWVQLGLQSQQAAAIARECGIMYEENSCIKIEHQRLHIH